jgi:hypothetical protein
VRIAQQVGDFVELSDDRLASQASTELVVPLAEDPGCLFDLLDFLVPHTTRPTRV